MNSRAINSAGESDGAPSLAASDSTPPRDGLPGLTPRQFLVIWLLLAGRKTGHTLRRELGSWGAGTHKSAFSHTMRRLEAAGLVRSDTVSEATPGLPKRYCVYQARVKALEQWRAASAFYARFPEPPGAEEHLFDEAIQRRKDLKDKNRLYRALTAYARTLGLLPEEEPD
jgi:DNA-binding PadR family transcriptional regulator